MWFFQYECSEQMKAKKTLMSVLAGLMLASNVAKAETLSYCSEKLGIFKIYGNEKSKIVLTDGNHLQDYSFPVKLTEKTDVEFRAESSSGSVNFNVSASLNILYVQN